MNWGLLVWCVRIYFLDIDVANDYFKGYVVATAVANLLYFIFSIIAAVKARRGRMYYFIFFGRLTYEIIFNKSRDFRYQNDPEGLSVNRPPA